MNVIHIQYISNKLYTTYINKKNCIVYCTNIIRYYFLSSSSFLLATHDIPRSRFNIMITYKVITY